jgi:hypothetical protein
MKVTKSVARDIAKKIKLNTDVVDIDTFQYALNVELEHGSKLGKMTNVTKDNLTMTTKIVLAHLFEFPDYYTRLKKLEDKAEEYWGKREKPNILL